MSWQHPLLRFKPLSMAIALTTMVGCSSQPPVREFISVKPEAQPLNKSVLQSMQPNSTDLLKRAGLWYENSGQLLNSVTEPSVPSGS
ncbi:hypothetical protein D3C87_1436400 [compost metagenome]